MSTMRVPTYPLDTISALQRESEEVYETKVEAGNPGVCQVCGWTASMFF